MSGKAIQRVKADLEDIRKTEANESSKCGISVEIVNDNFLELKGTLCGPPDTAYEGGKFILHITIPEMYPFRPPQIRFVTKIWHPNISSVTGAVCLDILKENWEATMSLRTVLVSLQALLSDPYPDNPQDAVVASQYKENPEMFWQTARHWAQAYAGAPISVSETGDQIIT